MIERGIVQTIARRYGKRVRVATIGSHSALDVCDGAAEEGLETLVFCQEGRDAAYSRHFRARRDGKGNLFRGVVDRAIVLPKFADLVSRASLKEIKESRAVFVPNRALTSYLSVEVVEDDFLVPLFGSRAMLRSEERSEEKSYYWLLGQAGLPAPRRIEDSKDIDRLAIVKLHHAEKRLERGFFTCASAREYREKSAQLVRQGVITEADLAGARIEEYIIGPVFNLDFFLSPLAEKGEELELLGVDWRFESSLDGHVRLPAAQQMTLGERQSVPEYTVVGHNSATLRESLLEKAYELGERYVAAAREHHPPGIIGPFCLQTCVDKDLGFHIYDVAPRIGGGTNVHVWSGHAYGNALWRQRVSTGRRIAMELRRAAEEERLDEVVT
jgi:5-formaminoimidazole-4-carboxamide-1-(beta)-D-ribofuranosyl 5'-monophosphate synthetase